VGKILHFGITLALPAYLHGIEKVWAPFLAYGCAGSFVLCWFFIVSHNLDGLRHNQLSKETKADWGRWQIETSASWGNAFWSFLSGGLNYQIEHHMFPGTAHNLYPAMAPIIKEECAKEGIPYNGFEGYFGLLPITAKMFGFLGKMAVNPAKAK
jgi:fatty acid desaturase